MSEERDWAAYGTWHEMLDALCADQGHLDNLTLAGQLCAATKNRTQAAFDTAVKNLRNWRQGVHIPQRRNFLLLTKLLKVDQHDGLRAHWNRLYSQAKVKPSDKTATAVADGTPAAPKDKARWPVWAGGGAAIAIAAALSAVFLWSGQQETIADPAASPAANFEGIQAEYVRNVSAKIGDALIVHGARGNECGEAPSWESAKLLLPTLVTGTLTDGGVGTRFSRQCGGRVPARAILFTATTPGVEQISLYGDEVLIRVME